MHNHSKISDDEKDILYTTIINRDIYKTYHKSINHEIIDCSNLPRIADYVQSENFIEGERCSIDDVLDKSICILAVKDDIPSRYKNFNGEYGTYAALQFFYIKDTKQIRYRLNTGSEVLRDKLRRFQERYKFPAIGVIRKFGKYYTFT